MNANIEPSFSTVLIVFGATGDLTSRKLIPALFALFVSGRLPASFAFVGVSRAPLSDADLRRKFADAVRTAEPALFSEPAWERFAESIFYLRGDVGDSETFARLRKRLDSLPTRRADSPTARVFYLAISPRLYPTAIAGLERSGLAVETTAIRTRLVVEKPFGVDAESARELDRLARDGFDESRIFRVDHYLGKDAVDNVFALRFANSIFEPVWNRRHVESVQITAFESATVGRRGAFYETTGVLRDFFQNHLTQLLALVAMEPPVRFDARSIRDEKAKLLRSVRIPTPVEARRDLLLGQYDGYRAEPDVAPDSRVPTFAALRVWVDSWRWKDVPFYLRGGKGASCRTTSVSIRFKAPPNVFFSALGSPTGENRIGENGASYSNIDKIADDASQNAVETGANRLILQIQPAAGIRLSFLSKVPGTESELRENELTYSFETPLPDAYRRLLFDALRGDARLFARGDEIESAWALIDPFQRVADDAENPPKIFPYRRGAPGPDAARDWARERGENWLDACAVVDRATTVASRSTARSI